MGEPEEQFDVVDEGGRVLGRAARSECHGDPSLIHQAVHVMVLDADGRLFLQKRSRHKRIQPGKWDSSVGGHLDVSETPLEGARREMIEELGATPGKLEPAYGYLWKSPVETELIRTFVTTHPGPFRLHPDELEDRLPRRSSGQTAGNRIDRKQLPPGTYSSAPMSTASPWGRASPSMSSSIPA